MDQWMQICNLRCNGREATAQAFKSVHTNQEDRNAGWTFRQFSYFPGFQICC